MHNNNIKWSLQASESIQNKHHRIQNIMKIIAISLQLLAATVSTWAEEVEEDTAPELEDWILFGISYGFIACCFCGVACMACASSDGDGQGTQVATTTTATAVLADSASPCTEMTATCCAL